MKKLTSLAAALCLCGWMVGCSPEATDTAPVATPAAEGDHDHAEGEEHAHEEGAEHAEGEEAAAPAETPEAGSST